jgi:membrane peptidoglycan carboxypeptidase
MVRWVLAIVGFLLRAVLKLTLVLVIATLIGVSAGFIVALANYRSYASELVPPDQLALNNPSMGARILDRNGTLLYEFVDDKQGIRFPVGLQDVSPVFLAATIATEDSNFFVNPGVNPKGLARAAWENFRPLTEDGELLQGTGGSSITQQLVKNVYIPEEQRHERSIDRKAREIVYSIELTKRYDKAQILEWYVNQISYGGIYTGVEAAAQSYFGKPARDLNLAEAAFLAGIPQSPAEYDPTTNLEAALARRHQVLDLMAKHESIQIGADIFYMPNLEEIEAARHAPIEIRTRSFPIQAPHFVLTYLAPQLEKIYGREALLRDGLVITTTLDLNLHNRAQEIIDRWVRTFESSNTHNGATVVIEPHTGEILAFVGSRDYWREDIDGAVNNLLAPNSPGSSFKPFVYLTTFLKLGWNPSTIIQDSPISFRESNGTVFSPTNPNRGYVGPVSIRNALGNSLNVPAFKAALQVGVPAVVDFAKSVGITTLDGQYGPAISIGGVDLRPLDLSYAYSALANGGVMVGTEMLAPEQADERNLEPVSILRIEDRQGNVRFNIDDSRVERRVIPAEHAYLMSDILSDPGAQCMTFGCGGLNVPGYRVAVKTGTSEPYDPRGPNRGKIGETWAFGYTPDYVVGVWAGNSDNAPIVNILSTSISYRAMRDILLAAYNGRPGTPFIRPAGIVSRQVCSPPPPQRPPQPGENPPPPPQQVCRDELGVR